jgi:hypothetical protein
VNLTHRMAGIDVNLDDLQAGIEAGSRAADTLQVDTTKFNGLLKRPVLRAVVRHVKELKACARDQRAALQELREGISRLQRELTLLPVAVRPPPPTVPEMGRR